MTATHLPSNRTDSQWNLQESELELAGELLDRDSCLGEWPTPRAGQSNGIPAGALSPVELKHIYIYSYIYIMY